MFVNFSQIEHKHVFNLYFYVNDDVMYLQKLPSNNIDLILLAIKYALHSGPLREWAYLFNALFLLLRSYTQMW